MFAATRGVTSLALALACVTTVIAGCSSSDSTSPNASKDSTAGNEYTLENGVTVTIEAPQDWKSQSVPDGDGQLIWLAPEGEHRSLSEILESSDPQAGASIIRVANRDECTGSGEWLWADEPWQIDNDRGGEVRRRADESTLCVGVTANDYGGRTQATDLLPRVIKGAVVTSASGD
ncbi:hypothetical protein [Gordonia terrae]